MIMLKIRAEQLNAFERQRRACFVLEMCSYLRMHFTDGMRIFDEPELAGMVEESIARAARHGFLAPADIARYLAVCAVLGWDFEENPDCDWTRNHFGHSGRRSANQISRALMDELITRLRVKSEDDRCQAELVSALTA